MRRSNVLRRGFPAALLFASALAATNTAAAQMKVAPLMIDQQEVQTHVEGEILVKFHDEVPEWISVGLHADFGSRVVYESPYAGFQILHIQPGADEAEVAAIYDALPFVEYAEVNSICRSHATPNDPFFGFQWHFEPQIFDMQTAWDTATGSGAVVAVLDSGVAYENYSIPSWESNTVASGVTQYLQAPDLNTTSFTAGYDFVNGDTHPNDNGAHGTHVAGTIAQSTNNGVGVAGVAYNATIMPVKVLNYQGSGTASWLADGLYFCADNGADVANMSLGWNPGYNPGSTVSNAIAYAANAGVVLCASSGNAGVGTVSYPALYSQCIAVGASDYNNNRSYYSQYGSGIDVTAPGGDVTTDQNGDGYVDGVLQNTFVGYTNEQNKANPTSFSYYFYQGTSMASPHVAGVCALMISNGITGAANIRSQLESTCTDLGSSGYDTVYGHGLVNPVAAIQNGGGGDNTAPNPDPMDFLSIPVATGTSSITMTAETATDPSGVEYYFEETTGNGNDSGWQSEAGYTDTGLAPNTTCSYRVRARDLSSNQNQTDWSTSVPATTDDDGGGSGPVEISNDDFENGWGPWQDGGGDCRRYTRGTYSYQGRDSANIQDNSGTASSFYYANSVDLSSYSSLTIDFVFYARSMEGSENFFVEYFDGSSWQIVADFVNGVDFSNNSFWSANVSFTDVSYDFPSNASLRFRCDASGNGDDIYIDTLVVTAE